MNVAIIGAMEEEVVLLRQRIVNCQTFTQAGCEIYSGQLNGVNVALLKSGIGKVAAAMGTAILLQHYPTDIVINTGSAGGMAESLSIGDIVVSDEVSYHDADLTVFGYKPGQMAGCPARFSADASLIDLVTECIKEQQLNAVTGLICSGDSFISGVEPVNQIKHNFPDVIAVEMEAAAIGHVCHNFKVPFVVVRAISDVPGQQSHLSFEQFLSIAAKQSSLMVESMLTKLAAKQRT